MSSSITRRMKRKMERDVKKGKLIDFSKDRQLYIPSEEEIESYIQYKKFDNKMKDLNKSIEDGM